VKILALDASLGPFSAALDLDGVVTTETSDAHDALEGGLERIAHLLVAARTGLASLDRIAVGIGPGSFTGIRIAVSFAKALAYGAQLPLVGVSSYDVLVPPEIAEPSLAIISGRPGVICARLRVGAAVEVACGPIGGVLDTLLGGLRRDIALVLGTAAEDAAAAVAERLHAVKRLKSGARRTAAETIALLGAAREPTPSAHSVAPDYGEMPAVTRPKAATEIVP
jgi:tRNA threonylcarbamoyladenosine biosynthesis protein TsaB